jgi:hypothetical protein
MDGFDVVEKFISKAEALERYMQMLQRIQDLVMEPEKGSYVGPAGIGDMMVGAEPQKAFERSKFAVGHVV